MRARPLLALLFLAAACGLACAHVLRTSVHANPKADFSRYKTFSVTGTRIETDGQYMLRKEIIAHVEKKGLTPAAESPDLVIVSQLIRDASQRPEQTDFTSWWSGAASTEPTGNMPIGALVIDITDPVTKMLVWRGVATGTVPPSGLLRKAKVQVALDRLFSDFPPRPPSK